MKNLEKFIFLLLALIFSTYFSLFFHELGHYISGLQLNCESFISISLNPFLTSMGGCTKPYFDSLTPTQKAYSALLGQIFTLALGSFSLLILILKKKLDYKMYFLFFFLAMINFWVLFYNSAHAIFNSGLDWTNWDFDMVSAGYGINQTFFIIPSTIFLFILVFLVSKFLRKYKIKLLLAPLQK